MLYAGRRSPVVGRFLNYCWQNFLELFVADGNEAPGTLLAPVPVAIPEVTVTPVSVSHRNADKSVYDQRRQQYCCAAFVIETAQTKCILLWDIDLPRKTLLVHLSGHLDDPGNPGYGWSDQRWEEEASAVWQEEGLPGSVRVPHIGDMLTL